MADEISEEETEFEDAEIEEEIDPEDLDVDELDEDEAGFAGLDDDDDLAVIDEDEDDLGPEAVTKARPADKAPAAAAAVVVEEEDDDEDLVDPDDVEADLDTILKDRLVAADDEPEEDDDDVEVDDRGDPVDRIQPKRPGEFVCQSCFLVKHPGQLADAKRKLCSDCV